MASGLRLLRGGLGLRRGGWSAPQIRKNWRFRLSSPIHSKVGGAAVGGTVGVLIVAILQSCGVHVTTELPAATTAFCSAVGGWLAPSSP